MADEEAIEEKKPPEGQAANVEVDAEKQLDGAEKKEGTPDKALQRVQQDTATALRALAEINQKIDAGKALTPKEARKLDKVRDFLEAKDGVFTDEVSRQVSEALVETAEENASLKKELADAKSRLDSVENTVNWSSARTKYAGLDVDAIWEKAWNDAAETLGEDGTQAALKRVASRMFKERCDAAKKRFDAKDDAPEKKDKKKPSDDATYKVGSGQRPAPAITEDDEVLAEARSLVVVT